MLADQDDVVVTGVGVVSPIGTGRDAFWASLLAGQSGIRPYELLDASGLKVRFGGEVRDFDPKAHVRPRKSLKVMSRDIQLGFAAAELALQDAGLADGAFAPERMGVVFGADFIYCELPELNSVYRHCMVDGRFDFSRWGSAAASEMYPLWMLKYLPNMAACHIAIAHDARGPNNSIVLGEVSSLLAIGEGMRQIRRGAADVMLVGGASASRLHPTALSFRGEALLSRRGDDPAGACRPFDADRDGMVNGEGAAAFLLERRRHAEARGANILARLLAVSSRFESLSDGRTAVGRPMQGTAVRQTILASLAAAGLQPGDVGFVSANGFGTVEHDRAEAQAIRDALGDVAVTAAKSFFGNLGGAAGAVETAAGLLAIANGQIPPTLNFARPDPQCPVNVVRSAPRALAKRVALQLSQTVMGHAAAVVLAADS